MFTHPDTMFDIRMLENQDMHRRAAQQRLAATARPGKRSGSVITGSLRLAAASWLFAVARRLKSDGGTVASHTTPECGLVLSRAADA